MAELMGRATGVCNGKGGSMHVAAVSLGMLGASGIVGGMLPVAVGAALASRNLGIDRVVAAFFGDGAANTGVCHESMNLAAAWGLPVLFLCENNQYALTTPVADMLAGGSIARRAAAYGMRGEAVDGQDVLAVYQASRAAVIGVRQENFPRLLEFQTYRYREHAELGTLKLGYRSSDEIERWRLRDPILQLRSRLQTDWAIGSDRLSEIENTISGEIESAVNEARSGEPPPPRALFEDVFAGPLGLRREMWTGTK
jgi:pyruvate dehydrogenase E1 component alpha subunit